MSDNLLKRMNWPNSIFLTTTLFGALTIVPWYLWTYGIDLFQILLFIFYYFAVITACIPIGHSR